jgi:hypothetical protein
MRLLPLLSLKKSKNPAQSGMFFSGNRLITDYDAAE